MDSFLISLSVFSLSSYSFIYYDVFFSFVCLFVFFFFFFFLAGLYKALQSNANKPFFDQTAAGNVMLTLNVDFVVVYNCYYCKINECLFFK